ncbi:MAG TPA: metal-dependent hydrolase [Thermoanaerobaculia bacterium]|nr:metal-dependent hydrolase [Thermoanaerobaculia bacterium]
MNPITHALTGWCLAEAIPNVTTREKALITVAAIAPDVDGLGIFAELATRDSARPLLWWTDYHHLLGHNLLFAIAASLLAALVARTARATTAACVFIAVHLHILGDLAGSRGPDGYQWPIPYLYPLDAPPLAWSGQWRLNAWPNIALTVALLAITMFLAWKRGYSIVGLLSQRADRAFVDALRLRVRRSFCSHG